MVLLKVRLFAGPFCAIKTVAGCLEDPLEVALIDAICHFAKSVSFSWNLQDLLRYMRQGSLISKVGCHLIAIGAYEQGLQGHS